MLSPDLTTINHRYMLQHRLGKGGMGAVFRAYDRLQKQDVALKQVLTIAESSGNTLSDSGTNIRLMLANEFQTLASIHHPHIIRVLDYGFDDNNQPFFTMSLLENAKTLTEYGINKSIEVKTTLLLQTLQALTYLHRRNVVHRDLKPDNTLVTPEGDVKVLDFGLATAGQDPDENVAGTIAYIAPEVLQGNPATVSSDLYAFGIMAYELLAGEHPYDTSNPVMLIQDVMLKTPDMEAIDLGDQVHDVLDRLTQKDPYDRYDDPYEVLRDFCAALDVPMPQETAAIRESFLQSAKFVGRETEMTLLRDALTAAVRGKGSAWLIGGESGVGKSRLMSELRTLALVRGALVVTGHAVPGGGMPFQMWREPLRRLLLGVALDDLEASILKRIIPDISDLIGRDVADAADVNGNDEQQRIMEVIASVIRQQNEPVVILLEDLQWAIESLDVFRNLIPLAGSQSLLLVGNYRSDERPNLPETVSEAQHIRLERLDESSIEQLSTSMLGVIGRRPALLELLKRETEGNVFFLVEVVRALAEEAGRLSDVGTLTLPARIFAGGMQQIVQRRLAHVPDHARYLLTVAAVAGRRIDTKLLQAIAPDTNLEDFLVTCSNIAVLEVNEEIWSFTHDKLREGLTEALPPGHLERLHLLLADKLQAVYGALAEEYAMLISDHYERGGALADAAHWHAIAGQNAISVGAGIVAENSLRRALNLWDKIGPPADSAEYRGTLRGLAQVMVWQARYEEATQLFEKLRSEAVAAGQMIDQARALYGLAEVQRYRGEMQAALDAITQAEEIARSEKVERTLASTLTQKGAILMHMDLQASLKTSMEALELCDKLPDLQVEKSQVYNALGIVHYFLGDYVAAINNFERALALQQELGQKVLAMASFNNVGYLIGARGDYETAVERFREAIKLAREFGHHNAEMIYRGNLGGALMRLGNFDEAERELLNAIDQAEIAGLAELSEMFRFLAEAYLGKRRYDAARDAAVRALTLGKGVNNPEYIAAAWCVLGQIVAVFGGYLEVTLNDEVTALQPVTCFTNAEKICRETGIMGELARTLREWARYEASNQQKESARTRWAESRELFKSIGADIEYENMPAEPV